MSKSLKSQLTNTIKDADLDLKKRIEQAENLLTNKTPNNEIENLSTEKKDSKNSKLPISQAKAIKVIKENYTMPESDYQLLETLRKRFATRGNILSKSETIRAGLQALAVLSDEELSSIATNLVKLKPGRVPVKKQ